MPHTLSKWFCPPRPTENNQGRLSSGPEAPGATGFGETPIFPCQRAVRCPREHQSQEPPAPQDSERPSSPASGWSPSARRGHRRDWTPGQGQEAREDAFPPPGSSSCCCHGYICFLFDSSQTAERGVPAPSTGHRCVGLFTTAACGIPRKRLQTGHPAAAKYPGVKS